MVVTTSDGRELGESIRTFGECEVAGIPPVEALDLPIRHVCQLSAEEILKEGAPASEWVTTRRETTYDGYGATAFFFHEGQFANRTDQQIAPGDAVGLDEIADLR